MISKKVFDACDTGHLFWGRPNIGKECFFHLKSSWL